MSILHWGLLVHMGYLFYEFDLMYAKWILSVNFFMMEIRMHEGMCGAWHIIRHLYMFFKILGIVFESISVYVQSENRPYITVASDWSIHTLVQTTPLRIVGLRRSALPLTSYRELSSGRALSLHPPRTPHILPLMLTLRAKNWSWG